MSYEEDFKKRYSWVNTDPEPTCSTYDFATDTIKGNKAKKLAEDFMEKYKWITIDDQPNYRRDFFADLEDETQKQMQECLDSGKTPEECQKLLQKGSEKESKIKNLEDFEKKLEKFKKKYQDIFEEDRISKMSFEEKERASRQEIDKITNDFYEKAEKLLDKEVEKIIAKYFGK